MPLFSFSSFTTDACVIELISPHTCRLLSCPFLLFYPILRFLSSLSPSFLSLSLSAAWNPQRTSNSSESTHSPTSNWRPRARARPRYSPQKTLEAPRAPERSRERRRAAPARFRRCWCRVWWTGRS